jgi:hypothetical protein
MLKALLNKPTTRRDFLKQAGAAVVVASPAGKMVGKALPAGPTNPFTHEMAAGSTGYKFWPPAESFGITDPALKKMWYELRDEGLKFGSTNGKIIAQMKAAGMTGMPGRGGEIPEAFIQLERQYGTHPSRLRIPAATPAEEMNAIRDAASKNWYPRDTQTLPLRGWPSSQLVSKSRDPANRLSEDAAFEAGNQNNPRVEGGAGLEDGLTTNNYRTAGAGAAMAATPAAILAGMAAMMYSSAAGANSDKTPVMGMIQR